MRVVITLTILNWRNRHVCGMAQDAVGWLSSDALLQYICTWRRKSFEASSTVWALLLRLRDAWRWIHARPVGLVLTNRTRRTIQPRTCTLSVSYSMAPMHIPIITVMISKNKDMKSLMFTFTVYNMYNMNFRSCQLNVKILGHNIRFKHFGIYISFLFAFVQWHVTTKKAMFRVRIWIRNHWALLDTNIP